MIALGIHKEGSALKLARLKKEKQSVSFELLRTLSMEDEGNVKQLYMQAAEKAALVSGLEPGDIFLRNFHLKLVDKRKIYSALPYQVEGLLPYTIQEAVVAIHIERLKGENASKICLQACKEVMLQKHLEELRELSIDPERISSVQSALSRFFSYFFPHEKDAFFFHIGLKQSIALCFKDKKIEISHPLHFGTEILIDALQKDLPGSQRQQILETAYTIDLQNIDPYTWPHFYSAVFQFQREIDRIFSFFQTKPYAESIVDVILTGNFSVFSKFREFFQHSLSTSFRVLPSPSLEQYDSTTLESFAVPIGFALEEVSSDAESTQFRQKKFFSETLIKKRIKSLYSYAGFSLGLTLITFLLGHLYEKKAENRLDKKLQTYFPSESFDMDGIKEKISALEKKTVKQKKAYPFLLSVPNVSDILAWACKHPQLCFEEVSEGRQGALEIKHFKYQLVQMPKIGSIQTPYVAKVELSFASPSSRLAREFHNALLKGDDFVDETKEISWEVADNSYRVSFFLKPKRGPSL